MENRMDLATVVTAMPNATPLPGLPEAWHWAKVPGFDFGTALSGDGKHLLQLIALRSYDEDLVTAVLAFARRHESELIGPPDQPLALVEGFAYPGRGFDTVVAVGPGVHKFHEKDGPLHELTRSVFPAYRCEFSGTENEEEARYRYSRASGATPNNLNREPRPVIKLTFKPDDNGPVHERDYWTPNALQYMFPRLADIPDKFRAPDPFVEFENYENRVWRVEWDGTYNIAELTANPDERRELDLEELLEYAKTVLYGPNLGAGTSEFTKKN
jgi:hypothetical protein